eukprot:scaffold4957_cov390-Prasinococcus_capsulatus_cf.AAC.5
MDYSGSLVIFVSGGTFAFVGSLMTGPRIGRFTESGPKELPASSPMLIGLGTIFLWFGWYGLTSGRAPASQGMFDVAAKVCGRHCSAPYEFMRRCSCLCLRPAPLRYP